MEEKPTTRIHLLCHITSITNRSNSIIAIIRSLTITINSSSSSKATILATPAEPSVCDRATKPEAVPNTINQTTIAAATAAYRTTVAGTRLLTVNSSSSNRLVHGHRISLDGTPDEEKMTWTAAAAEVVPCIVQAEAFGLT